MPIVLSVIAIIVLILLVINKFSAPSINQVSSRSGGKCISCVYGYRILKDGVICGTKDRNVFKNLSHISGCLSYESKSYALGEK